MLIQILKHTPLWVLVLFFVLLALGYLSSRPRNITRGRLAILPAVMILLSAHGVVAGFGYRWIGVGAWVVGMALAMPRNQALQLPRGATYSATPRTFTLPGSWIPLALMMVIFFTKYAVAVILALDHALNEATPFVAGICLFYGLLSGMFLSSALALWRLERESRRLP